MGKGSKVANSEVKTSVILMESTVVDSYLDRVLVMKGSTVRGAHIENSIIGEGCTVKEGCRISNAVIADNTVLEAGTVLDGGRNV